MGKPGGRLSEAQLAAALEKAKRFRREVEATARAQGERGEGEKAFFPEVFRIASELIEKDADEFCDRAGEIFEEIEAHGQEPQLDDDWIDEITGEKDNFYFSTDSLVSEMEPLPGRKRGRKPLTDTEVERITREVSNAIIDDDDGQSFEEALAVAHAENVDDWINNIKSALNDCDKREIEFWRLHKLTHLRPTELFLGLLLGQQHWAMRQDNFYGKLFVALRNNK